MKTEEVIKKLRHCDALLCENRKPEDGVQLPEIKYAIKYAINALAGFETARRHYESVIAELVEENQKLKEEIRRYSEDCRKIDNSLEEADRTVTLH